jgi:hypothetical protein
VWYDYQILGWDIPNRNMIMSSAKLPGPAGLRKVVGDDFFATVVMADFCGKEFTDDRLEFLANLKELKWLSFSFARITDTGMEQIGTYTQLQGLNFNHTQITDRGLDHLHRLKQLQDIAFTGTQVTEEGVRRFQRAIPICRVTFFSD